MNASPLFASAFALVVFSACATQHPESRGQELLAKYTTVRLEADLDGLSAAQKEMLPLLIEAAEVMDGLFWRQAYGDKNELLGSVNDDHLRRFVEINYGPWDRLDGNASFLEGAEAKPAGARFYPRDAAAEDLDSEAWRGLYTIVQRDSAGDLQAVPYHVAFATELTHAAQLLLQASDLAEDPGFKHYLELRAAALTSSEYRASDMAWLDMKNNTLDIVIGPIETYEDQLFGAKAAFEAYVLIKDQAWSKRLARYAAFLPELQRGLPVPDAYKRETPGTESDLNAYEVIYYAGDCNAGSKTIAINLPNDETVQLAKGTRRLQLKNAMKAKFDGILEPIADQLIAADQRAHVTFDAFFANTMFHEVAHGLGIKRTLDGKGTVREALKNQASAVEEGKADILGLYMVTRLHGMDELGQADLLDNYVTFLASVFRSIRFGASSAHGRANLVRFNFFAESGAFEQGADGKYRVHFEKMGQSMAALSEKLLRLQGDGNYDEVASFMTHYGVLGPELQSDLDALASAGIPVDVVFEQGLEVLGLR